MSISFKQTHLVRYIPFLYPDHLDNYYLSLSLTLSLTLVIYTSLFLAIGDLSPSSTLPRLPPLHSPPTLRSSPTPSDLLPPVPGDGVGDEDVLWS